MPVFIIGPRVVLIDDRGKLVMGRVIRISAVVMGVLLVGMTGGLKWVRGEERADILVLHEDDYLANRLYWLDPTSPHMTPLVTGIETIQNIGTSSNGEWLYYIGGRGEAYDADGWLQWIGALYRVRVGESPELVVPYIDAFKLIRTSKWLIYPQEHEASNGSIVVQIIRLDLDSFEQQLLTRIETLNDVRVGSPFYVSNDRQWVIFNLRCWDWACMDYYRVGINGAPLEKIPNPADSLEGLDSRLTWVSENGYNVLYWRDPARQLRPVTIDWTKLGFSQVEVFQWLVEAQILIIRLVPASVYWAVHPTNPNPIWMINGADYFEVYSDDGWIIYRDWNDFSLWRMRLDGTELMQLIPSPTIDWKFDSSEKVLFYKTEADEWRRITMDGKEDQLIYRSPSVSGFLGHSPQEKWLVFNEWDSYGVQQILRIRQDRKVIEPLTPKLLNLGSQFSITWMTAPIPRWNYLRMTLFGVSSLAFGGGSGVVWSYFRRRSGAHE